MHARTRVHAHTHTHFFDFELQWQFQGPKEGKLWKALIFLTHSSHHYSPLHIVLQNVILPVHCFLSFHFLRTDNSSLWAVKWKGVMTKVSIIQFYFILSPVAKITHVQPDYDGRLLSSAAHQSHQTSAQNGATSFSQDCRGGALQMWADYMWRRVLCSVLYRQQVCREHLFTNSPLCLSSTSAWSEYNSALSDDFVWSVVTLRPLQSPSLVLCISTTKTDD